MKSGVLRDKTSTMSPARWAGALSCWKVALRAVSKLIGIFHIGNFCFWVLFLKQLLLRNYAVDFVEIYSVYIREMIIKAAKRIFNSDKICRSYSDLNFWCHFFGTQCIFGSSISYRSTSGRRKYSEAVKHSKARFLAVKHTVKIKAVSAAFSIRNSGCVRHYGHYRTT